MSIAKLSRDPKRQLGQFFTPQNVAQHIVRDLQILPHERVLEPAFGAGAFVFALLDYLTEHQSTEQVNSWARSRLYGCELDEHAIDQFTKEWQVRNLGAVPHNIERHDFFRWLPPNCDRQAALDRDRYFQSPLEFFDVVVGNPPFGGSIDPDIADNLDSIFGIRNGKKIKKETYAFFLIKSLDLLRPGGRLCFICSDTILTIPTMRGVRSWLQERCEIRVAEIPGRFDETAQTLILVTLVKRGFKAPHIWMFGKSIRLSDVERTPNLSWLAHSEYARYFRGPLLGDMIVGTSGMTTGNNPLFVREIADGFIEEPYEFCFATEPITLVRELWRARLGKLSIAKTRAILEKEQRGDTTRVVRWRQLEKPAVVKLPHKDYRYYNKSTEGVVYAPPKWVIFWRKEGEYVYTYKKSGKWYLHGVGGRPYFGKEGLTWNLIASRLRTRWLRSGYILDSGAPCAFLRDGVAHDELFYIMGWTLTELCTSILKNVVNHTRNIQSKDFERLPYPNWTTESAKLAAIARTKALVRAAVAGKRFTFKSPELVALNELYEYRSTDCRHQSITPVREQEGLLNFVFSDGSRAE